MRNAEEAARSVAILAFHKIGEPPRGTWTTWNYVPRDTFEGYMRHLRDEDYHVLTMSAFLSGLEEPESLPEKSALITFDDGYASMLEQAEPALGRFGYPSVLFVPTGFIGATNRFDEGNEPEERICDWDELCELERRGVSIQSHGSSHRAFSELSPEELDDELRRSKDALEENLEEAVEVFAFPFGDNGRNADATDAALKSAGYRAACLYKGGPAKLPATHQFRLTRLAMGPDSNLRKMLGGLP